VSDDRVTFTGHLVSIKNVEFMTSLGSSAKMYGAHCTQQKYC